MKNLLLVLTLTTTLLSNAQKQFAGCWESSNSNFTTTILADDKKVSKVFNFSFRKNRFINEDIISQNPNEIKTKLVNDRTGYTVIVKYYLKNKDTLINEYSGDYNEKVSLTRVKINN
jgi:hypothetical protein